ncbi:MAG: recombinase family protein [Methanomassiliicoccales archaeon]
MREEESGSMRVALYARVSTDDKDQNPETQLFILRDYCRIHGHEIVDEFVDEGRSGKDPNRPAFKKMMEEAKDKKHRRFEAIVCLRLDRFMRSALYGLQATQELKEAECDLIFVKDQIDTTTPGGKFFYTLMLAFAEMEREHHAERVREGIQRRIREGGRWGKGARKDVNVPLAVELLRTGKARSVSEAAKILKVPRSTLVDHARRKGIDLSDYTPPENRGDA